MASVVVVSSGDVGRSHDTGPGHPERAERLAAVERGIAGAAEEVEVKPIAGRDAALEDLLRVHDAGYLERLQAFIAGGGRSLDADTTVSARSWSAALLGAGSGLAAIEALEAGGGTAAFVAVRPPGHHASSAEAMGFCLLNNVAVSAAALVERGQRVVIVDWDVHHGNGTEEIFWDEPSVLYASTHQWHLYPGTGRYDATGGLAAAGNTVNVPLPSGATGDAARASLEEVIGPEVARFEPDWVLISAGFDAHRDDPLAGLEWSSGDYADLATTVASWAPTNGRVVAFLEGGYDLTALERSTAATISALGGSPIRPEPVSSGGPGLDQVTHLAEWRRTTPWW